MHKVDYEGDTNDKNHGSNNSLSETDGCVRNLDKEHGNEEDEQFKEDTSKISDTNESNLVQIKKRSSHKHYVSQNFLAQSNPISNFLN